MAVKDIEDKRIDRYLTNFIQDYSNGQFVGDFIAPPFKVKNLSGKYLKYTKDAYRVYNNTVGRDGHIQSVDIQADDGTYACVDYALRGFVNDSDIENAAEPVRLPEDKTKRVKDLQNLAREDRIYQIADSITYVTNYTDQSGAWSTTASATPVEDILDSMIEINNNSPATPANAIVMNMKVALTAIKADNWKDYFKYTGVGFESLFDVISGLRHLHLEPMIANAFGSNTNKGGASDPGAEAMWSDNVLVFHREPRPTTQTNTFMFSPFTNFNIVRKYRDETRGIKGGTDYVVAETIDELLVNTNCAHMQYNVLA